MFIKKYNGDYDNFTYYFEFTIDDWSTESIQNRIYLIGWSNEELCEEDAETADANWIGIIINYDGSDQNHFGLLFHDVDAGTRVGNGGNKNELNKGQTYYVKTERIGTTWNTWVYTDEAMTTAVAPYDPFTVTLQSDYRDLDEMILTSSQEDATAVTVTGSLGYLRISPTKTGDVLELEYPVNEQVNATYTPYPVDFNYTPSFDGYNATLFLNVSGTWQAVANNASQIYANRLNTITYSLSTPAKYVWNVRIHNGSQYLWASSNRTFTFDAPDPPTANGAWLSGWTYRKAHRLNPSTGIGANYSFKLKVWRTTGTDAGNNVYLGNKVQADFGDVRFTDDDGVTLLDYWIENTTDTYAIFWVEEDDNLTSTAQDFYIYYGATTTQSTTSNIFNTFDFADDFEDGDYDGWDASGDLASVSVVNGSLIISEPSSGTTFKQTLGVQPDGYRVLAGLKISKSGYATIRIKSSSDLNLDTIGYGYGGTGETIGWKNDGSTWSTGVSASYGKWHSVEWRVPDTSIDSATMIVDETSKSAQLVTTGLTPYNMSLLGGATNSPIVYFDWVVFDTYVSPEPSHEGWSSEESQTGPTAPVLLGDLGYNTTEKGAVCLFSGKWNQTGAPDLSYAIMEWNITGTYTQVANISLTGKTDWANTTQTLPSNLTKLYWKWTCYNTYGNSTTASKSFTFTTYPPTSIQYGHNNTYANYPTLFYSQWGANGRTLDKAKLEWDLGSGYVWVETKSITSGWANFTHTIPLSVQDSILSYRITANNTLGESTTITNNISVPTILPSYSNLDHNSTDTNTNCTFSCFWVENGGATIDTILFEWDPDMDGVFDQIPVTPFSGWSNITRPLLSSYLGYAIQYRFVANNTYGNITSTENKTVLLGSAYRLFHVSGASGTQKAPTTWTQINEMEINVTMKTGEKALVWFTGDFYLYGIESGRVRIDANDVAISFDAETSKEDQSLLGLTAHIQQTGLYTATSDGVVSFDVKMLSEEDDEQFWAYKNRRDLYVLVFGKSTHVTFHEANVVTSTPSPPSGSWAQVPDMNKTIYLEKGDSVLMIFASSIYVQAQGVMKFKLLVNNTVLSLWADQWENGYSGTYSSRLNHIECREFYTAPASGLYTFSVNWTGVTHAWGKRRHLLLIKFNNTYGIQRHFKQVNSTEITSTTSWQWLGELNQTITTYTNRTYLITFHSTIDVRIEDGVYYQTYINDNAPTDPRGASTYENYGSPEKSVLQTVTYTPTQEKPTLFGVKWKTVDDWDSKIYNKKASLEIISLENKFTTTWSSSNNAPTVQDMYFTGLVDGAFIVLGLEQSYPLFLIADDDNGGSDISEFEFALQFGDSQVWINGSLVNTEVTLTAGDNLVSISDVDVSVDGNTKTAIISLRFSSSCSLDKLSGFLRAKDSVGYGSWSSFSGLAETIQYDYGGGGGGGGGGGLVVVDEEPEPPEWFKPAEEPEYLLHAKNPFTGEIIGIFPIPWKWTEAQKLSVIGILWILLMLLLGALLEELRRRRSKNNRKHRWALIDVT